MNIQNPILKGFNPDPAICRADGDFYIATSTFEWFPGVQIHHSKDLVHWQLHSRALTRPSQINMLGNHDSGGVWAPCLTHADGTFWLVYSDVKQFEGAYKDIQNYLVTTTDIAGEWGERIYLNGAGFDPSLFHDDDGRKYLVYMVWDHRAGNHPFYGIEIQEYSHAQQKLIGPKKLIFKGTDIRYTEGPHLYKKDGYYYLMVAEGGTGYHHAVTVARSEALFGDYTLHPENPILTSNDNPALPLQKAGHASIVPVTGDLWVLAHLCARPLTQRGDCPLGRETALQRLVWRGGWPYLQAGREPQAEIEAFGLPLAPLPSNALAHDDFDGDTLNIHYQSLRAPIGQKASLTARAGHLRLYGHESLCSMFQQAHLARRCQSLQCTAATKVDFTPTTFQQGAGLTVYYNTTNWFFWHITWDETAGRVLQLAQLEGGKTYTEHLTQCKIPVPADAAYSYLSATVAQDALTFAYSFDGANYTTLPQTFYTGLLSDDHIEHLGLASSFTGLFFGMACVDISGEKTPADFDWFDYQENE